MGIPSSFADLLTHPAPGFHFPPHRLAGTPEHVEAAPHRFGKPATATELAQLDAMTSVVPTATAQLREFYSRWNGVELCRVVGINGREAALNRSINGRTLPMNSQPALRPG